MTTKRMARLAVAIVCMMAVGACTVVNTAVIQPGRAPLITSGDVSRPYQSLGLVQATRKGVLLFFVISGFILALPFAKHFWQQGKEVNLKNYLLNKNLFRFCFGAFFFELVY